MATPRTGARICHIVGDSRFGGGSKIITRLAVAGRDAGYDVEVLATDPEFVSYVGRQGVPHVPVDCIWRPVRPHRDLLGLIRLCRFLRRSRYDLVHTHTSKAGFVGRLAARLTGVPAIVHTVHGFSFHEGSHPIPLRLYAALERAAAHWCHRMVTVSEFHRGWALELGIGSPESVLAVPNGIAEPPGVTDEARKQVRDEFGVGEEQHLVLSMGRLVEGKGLEDLVTAMSIMRDEGYAGMRLLLPGAGPSLESLVRLVSAAQLDDTVVMPGFRSDVGALLSAADAVVLPSYREGLSIALLEAMSAGKPIIASAIGSNLEATDGGNAAVIVPCGEPRALADAIVRLRLNQDEADELAIRARRRWEDQYTEERMISNYLGLYRELLNR
jgi:glycosyltransferase involved in cell wall biosynthesis